MGRYGRKIQLDEDVASALEQTADEQGESMTEMGNKVLRGSLIADGGEGEVRIVETNPESEDE